MPRSTPVAALVGPFPPIRIQNVRRFGPLVRRFLSGSGVRRRDGPRGPSAGGCGADRSVGGTGAGREYGEAVTRSLPSRTDGYKLVAAATRALPIDSTPWIVPNVP